ncbi:MAG: acyltransferase [Patescibacteria group bacterium]|nr:acyltransferase [Patescibacteria group bacterium]
MKTHATAEVHKTAQIGSGTSVWHHSQIRENVKIGENCIIGKNVYIDFGVNIGNNVKIQNNCSVYHGTTIEDGVFIGPHVIFTNDKNPRAINPDGSLKSEDDWEVRETTVRYGASISANSVILPGVELGKFCLVGAGAVVTKDVQPFVVGYGNPFTPKGYVCKCATIIKPGQKCPKCKVKLTREGKLVI